MHHLVAPLPLPLSPSRMDRQTFVCLLSASHADQANGHSVERRSDRCTLSAQREPPPSIRWAAGTSPSGRRRRRRFLRSYRDFVVGGWVGGQGQDASAVNVPVPEVSGLRSLHVRVHWQSRLLEAPLPQRARPRSFPPPSLHPRRPAS